MNCHLVQAHDFRFPVSSAMALYAGNLAVAALLYFNPPAPAAAKGQPSL